MKETIKINLDQRLFDLDIDAYEVLKKYLENLKRFFRKSPNEAEEILQDIEQRIADLLENICSDKKQIITVKDIDEVIVMMGTIEDFELEDEASENKDSSEHMDSDYSSDQNQKEGRRLHRDIDNNIFGGICSGIAAYFDVDTIWIRLAFVFLILFKGVGLLAYIILWFVVPAAKTTAQKLQMRGRPVNIENIEQSVKDEYNKVKENAKNLSSNESFKRMQSTLEEIFTTIGTVILVIIKIILFVVGITFIIAGIFIVLGIFAVIPLNNIPFWDHIDFSNIPFLSLAIGIIILIPIIAIFISSIRYVFNVKSRSNILSAFLWTIWTLVIVFVVLALISNGKVFSIKENIEDEAVLEIKNDSIIIIKMNDELLPTNSLIQYNIIGKEILYNKFNEECLIKPKFIIVNSSDSLIYLVIVRNSAFAFPGKQNPIYTYDYDWQLENDVLILDPYFSVEDEHIWTIPGMEVILKVPKGRKAVLNGDASELFERREIDSENSPVEEINF